MKQIKIYHANGNTGYSNWIPNRKLVKTVEEADVVFFEGGADVPPDLYGDKMGQHTYNSTHADRNEAFAYAEAIKHNKIMLGTCKGMQLFSAYAGGKLVQDMDHPGGHGMTTKDGKKFRINSLHHQCVNPYMLPKEDYEILAVSDVKSKKHLNGDNEDISEEIKDDIEAIYFPKIKAIGWQFHPEFMWNNNPENPLFQWLYTQIEEKTGLKVNPIEDAELIEEETNSINL